MSKKTTTKPAKKSINGLVTRWNNPSFVTKVWIGAQSRSDLWRAFRKISKSVLFDPKKCTKVKVTKI